MPISISNSRFRVIVILVFLFTGFLYSWWHFSYFSTSFTRTSTVVPPKVIWLSGFIWEDDFHKSWASTFPHYIRRLYPNARVFLIRRDSRFTVGKKALSYGFTIFELLLSSKGTIRAQLITEPPHPPSLPMWADVEVPPRFISHQVSFSQDPELAPDIHIIRNSFQIIDRILYYAPWLLPSSAFRVVFPIPDIGNQTQTGNYVDYIVHADEMLKPLPSWQKDIFEDALRTRIKRHDKFVLPKEDGDTESNYILRGFKVDPEGTDYRNLLPLKDNMLFYPAKIDPRKNQLAFAEMADADLLKEHNISLVFAGDIEDREYAEKVWETLDRRGIHYIFKGLIGYREEMASLFVRARGVLLLSKEDPGPRVLFEGLYANTPFLISDDVTIDPRIERFGMRASMRSSHDLNQALKEFLVARMDLSSSALSFARELDENLELTKLIKRIENHYQVDLFEKRQKHS